MFWACVFCVSSMLLARTVCKPEPYQDPVLWGWGVRRWITIVSSLISILGSHNVTASPQEGRKLEHKEEERKWWPCPWLAPSVVKVPWQCRGALSQPMIPLIRWTARLFGWSTGWLGTGCRVSCPGPRSQGSEECDDTTVRNEGLKT